MQRLLDDAGKIAGVEFDISNYSDVIQAIHVMQEQMGIAGTTAEEAEGTISGSIAMLGSAWQNFLTGVFDENADMGALGENLFTSLGAVISNIAPRILVLVQNLILGFPEAITTTLQAIPEMLAPAILEIFGTQLGGEINSALGGGVGELVVTLQELGESAKSVFEEILTTAQPILSAIVAVVQAAMPLVSQAIQLVVQFITRSVIPTVNSTIEIIRPVVEQISETIRAYMPEIQNIISGAMDAIQQIIETVWPVVSQIIITAAGAISSIVQEVWPFIEGAIDTATKAIQTVTEDIWPTVSGAVETAAGAIKTAIEGIETVVSTVERIFNDIKGFIEDPLGTAQGFVEDFARDIQNIIGGMNLSLPNIALPHFSVWGGEFPYGIGGYGSPPTFDVQWYGTGGFADTPTLTGYGDRGLEFYWPAYSPYFERYAQGIAEHMPMNGVDIHDCTFNVRKDSDIRAVAVELNTLINRQTTGAIR